MRPANNTSFLLQFITLVAALLFPVLSAQAMPLAPFSSSQAEFFPHQEVAVAEHTSVHFAARAPPLTSVNVAFTGAAVADSGNGVFLHGYETHVASLEFNGDFVATNRTLPDGYRVVDDSVGAARPTLDGGNRWVIDNDGHAIIQRPDGTFARTQTGIDNIVLPAPNRTQLIDDLVAGGTRITPENVVDIRSINGRTVWLETGNSSAGLQHITQRHAGEFAGRGVSEAQIPDLLFDAMQNGRVVGTTGSGRNVRSVYEVDFGGSNQRVAIGVGDNGFIVTAHPF